MLTPFNTARLAWGGLGLAALAACVAPPSSTEKKQASAPVECAQIATQFVANGTRITAVESVPAGLTVNGMAQPYPMPAHCKVSGKMNERTGVDGILGHIR